MPPYTLIPKNQRREKLSRNRLEMSKNILIFCSVASMNGRSFKNFEKTAPKPDDTHFLDDPNVSSSFFGRHVDDLWRRNANDRRTRDEDLRKLTIAGHKHVVPSEPLRNCNFCKRRRTAWNKARNCLLLSRRQKRCHRLLNIKIVSMFSR